MKQSLYTIAALAFLYLQTTCDTGSNGSSAEAEESNAFVEATQNKIDKISAKAHEVKTGKEYKTKLTKKDKKARYKINIKEPGSLILHLSSSFDEFDWQIYFATYDENADEHVRVLKNMRHGYNKLSMEVTEPDVYFIVFDGSNDNDSKDSFIWKINFIPEHDINSFKSKSEYRTIGLISYTQKYHADATSWLSHPDDVFEDYFASYFDSRYSPSNLFDGKLETAWVPGNEKGGIGEAIYIRLTDNSSTINFYNGYGKSQSLFEMNNRVKQLELTYYFSIHPDAGWVSNIHYIGGSYKYPGKFIIQLEDKPGLQTITLPLIINSDDFEQFKELSIAAFTDKYSDFGIVEAYTVIELKIVDVYKGSRWDDTCISEIFFSNTYVADSRLFKYEGIKNVYVDPDNDSMILIDLPDAKTVPVIEDRDYVFQVMENSADNQWITAVRMPANVGTGRIETQWVIINTFLGEIMNEEIEKTYGDKIFGPFFLSGHNNNTMLEFEDENILLK